MADRFDKFTERARRTLIQAREEAHSHNHNYIGTEHILLALLRESEGLGIKVLQNMGTPIGSVQLTIENLIGRDEKPFSGEIGLTPRAKKVIELAVDEGRRQNLDYIGIEHILVGLVREGKGIAAGVLENFGVNLERVRAEMSRLHSQGKILTAELTLEENITGLETQLKKQLEAVANTRAELRRLKRLRPKE